MNLSIFRKAAALLAFVFLGFSAGAQHFFGASEYGVSFGGSQYFGDLNDEYGFKFVRPALGIFYRHHLNPFISVKGMAHYTRIGYDDNFSQNVYNRKRNLNFRSNIIELAAQAEFNFFRFATGETGNRWTPYLTGGVGVFYYNPMAEFDGRWYSLRALGTEGQNAGFDDRKYNSISVCFPVGAGFKYWVRPGMNIGFEIANRLTLTDYMDDVSTTYVGADLFPNDPLNPNPAYFLQDRSLEQSPADPLGRAGKQRGNATSKDQYLFFLVQLSIQLKVYKCPAYLDEVWQNF